MSICGHFTRYMFTTNLAKRNHAVYNPATSLATTLISKRDVIVSTPVDYSDECKLAYRFSAMFV